MSFPEADKTKHIMVQDYIKLLQESYITYNKGYMNKELDIHIVDIFDNFFEENIFSQIDYSKTAFLDWYGVSSQTPTSRITLRNSNNEWLFDYTYDQKNQRFWYSYDRVYTIFKKKFLLQDVDIDRLMKSLVEKHFNLDECQLLNTAKYIQSW